VRSPAELDRAMSAASEASLDYVVLDKNVETTFGKLSISTMCLAKGLEFRAVAVNYMDRVVDRRRHQDLSLSLCVWLEGTERRQRLISCASRGTTQFRL
jgi:hypothetical protein